MADAAHRIEIPQPAHLRLLPAPRRACALIASAAYVDQELAAELGKLPPAFLPLGQRPLYAYQVELVRPLGLPVVLTLPEDFALSEWDERELASLGVQLLRLPVGLALTASVAEALGRLQVDGEVALLWGDTLLERLPEGQDVVATAPSQAYQRWAGCRLHDDGQVQFTNDCSDREAPGEVVSGFFRFSDAARLQRALRCHEALEPALTDYAGDVPVTPATGCEWLDFGHLNQYYQSRARALVARSFNQVEASETCVTKRSRDAAKILAEAHWYTNLPEHLRPHVPHHWGVRRDAGGAQYTTEYLYQSPLNELFVFGRLPAFVWDSVLDGCAHWLRQCWQVEPGDCAAARAGFAERFHRELWMEKSYRRVARFAGARGIDMGRPLRINGTPTPGLDAILGELLDLVPPTSAQDVRLWHGDFCFSNIFYDFRSQRVRVVDPRGMLPDGTQTLFGDARYDLAKLNHSLWGLYDHILAGRVDVEQDGRYALHIRFGVDAVQQRVRARFAQLRLGAYRVCDPSIRALTALLFFSMLPLHADNPARQTALFANALRLYRETVTP